MTSEYGHESHEGEDCDGDEAIQRLHEQIAAHIVDFGQSLVAVDEGDERFLYTVGNHAAGLPELLLVGVNPSSFFRVLNHLGQMQRDLGRGFEDGELVEMGGRFPVKASHCGRVGAERYAIQAEVHCGEEVSVVQILIPDTQGRFPGEEGCDEPYASQPVLAQVQQG